MPRSRRLRIGSVSGSRPTSVRSSRPRFPADSSSRTGAQNEAVLRDWLDLPRQGVLFDVEHNGFWLDEWGRRPKSLEQVLSAANDLLQRSTAADPRLWPPYDAGRAARGGRPGVLGAPDGHYPLKRVRTWRTTFAMNLTCQARESWHGASAGYPVLGSGSVPIGAVGLGRELRVRQQPRATPVTVLS